MGGLIWVIMMLLGWAVVLGKRVSGLRRECEWADINHTTNN